MSTKPVREDAARAQLQGDWSRALQAYDDLCALQPNDPIPPHRSGELLYRMGRPAEAHGRLLQAADLYARQGFVIKAIAICRILLKIDPTDLETRERLRQLESEKRESEISHTWTAPFFSTESPSLDLREVPVLTVGPSELARLSLGPREGFILHQIDGTLTCEDLLDICAMPPAEVLAVLTSLVESGAIRLRPGSRAARPRPPAPKSVRKSAP